MHLDFVSIEICMHMCNIDVNIIYFLLMLELGLNNVDKIDYATKCNIYSITFIIIYFIYYISNWDFLLFRN